METDSTFVKWYKKNRESFNAIRRYKYETDSLYRARCIEKAKQYYEKSKKEEAKKLKTIEEKIPAPELAKVRSVLINGEPMVELAGFAKIIGKSTCAIRRWELRGVLPVTPYRGKGGRRFYTQNMILSVYEALKDQEFPYKVNEKALKDEIVARWQAMRIKIKFRG